MGVAATASQATMGSAHSSAAVATAILPTTSTSSSSSSSVVASQPSSERRAGSSRIRRPPKRLLSPPASQPQVQSSSRAWQERSTQEGPRVSSSCPSDRKMASVEVDHIANSATEPSSQPRSRSQRQNPKAQQVDTSASSPTSQHSPLQQNPLSTPQHDSSDNGDTGPGKRKRRPSSMTKPPATITASAATSPTNASGLPSSASIKGHHKPSAESIASSRSSNKFSRSRHSTGSCLKKPHLPSLEENAIYNGGYESDGGRPYQGADRDHEGEADEADQQLGHEGFDHLEAPPLIFQTKGNALLRAEAGERLDGKMVQKSKKRAGSSSSGKKVRRTTSTSPPFGRTASPAPPCPGVFAAGRLVQHVRTQSLPSISRVQTSSWARRSLHGSSAKLTGSAASKFASTHVDIDSDSSADEHEDDFHRMMLDSDFEELDSWTKLSDVDTPATTPRSPQSSCGQLESHDAAVPNAAQVLTTPSAAGEVSHSHRGIEAVSAKEASSLASDAAKSPVVKEEIADSMPPKEDPTSDLTRDTSRQGLASTTSREKDRQDCNTVFAHALPPSDRPKTQVDLLTLSLPFGDIKGYTPPRKSNGVGSQVTTPVLERSASGDNPREAFTRHSFPGSRAQSSRSNGKDAAATTSPTLSPTQVVFSFPHVDERKLGSCDTDDDKGSVVASPFLAAVGRHRGKTCDEAAVEDRSVSPVPFRLPRSHASASTGGFSEGGEERPAQGNDEDGVSVDSGSSSPGKQEENLDDSSGEQGSCGPEESTFSLPETMALDEIDAAYGGFSQPVVSRGSSEPPVDIAALPSAVSLVRARADKPEETRTKEANESDHGRNQCGGVSKTKRQMEYTEADDAVSATHETADVSASATDDSPRPRKMTRARIASPERTTTRTQSSHGGRSRRGGKDEGNLKCKGGSSDEDSKDDDVGLMTGGDEVVATTGAKRNMRPRSSRTIRRPVK